jgi:phage anti-repressor protein
MEIINYVERALALSTSCLTVTEFVRVAEFPIDQLYVDRFWSSIEDGRWLYLSTELINWMGYKGILKKQKERCMLLLESNFEIDNDYIILNNKEYSESLSRDSDTKMPKLDMSNGKNNTKHILVTPNTFREMAIYANTKRSKQIGKYYIAVEKLLKDYTKYQNQYQLAIRDKNTALQLADMESKMQEMTIFHKGTQDTYETVVKNLRLKDKQDNIYIMTTVSYAKQRLFKIGRAKNIQKRLSSLNTSRVGEDLIYVAYSAICHDASEIERLLHKTLTDLNHEKEWFRCNFHALCDLTEYACNHYNTFTEYYHNIIKRIITNEIIIPEPIFITKKTLAIEDVKCVEYIDTLNKEQIEELIVSALNKYPGIDNSTHHIDRIKLKWVDVQKLLKEEVLPQKINKITGWKTAFKSYIQGSEIYDCIWRNKKLN